MSELSSEARSLIDAARPHEGPAEGERDQVRRSLAATLAAGAAVGAATTTSAAAGAAHLVAKGDAVTTAASLVRGGAATTAASLAKGSAVTTATSFGTTAKVAASLALVGALGGGALSVARAPQIRPPAPLSAPATPAAPTATHDGRLARAGGPTDPPTALVVAPPPVASQAAPEAPAAPDLGPTFNAAAAPKITSTSNAAVAPKAASISNATSTSNVPAAPIVADPLPPSGNAPQRPRSLPGGATPAPLPSQAGERGQPADAQAGLAAMPKPGEGARPSSQASALDEEVRELSEVQRALREGDAARALRRLDAGGATSGGALRDERRAARFLALCRLGRGAEANEEAARLLAASPSSPVASRVRKGCPLP
jgi:hypothetical protein